MEAGMAPIDPEHEECCYWCRFWKIEDDKDGGKCCRHAPKPIRGNEFEILESAAQKEQPEDINQHIAWSLSTYWPYTDWEDWCGEFSPHHSRRLIDPGAGAA